MSGSGTPTTGTSPLTMPALMNTYTKKVSARLEASRRAKVPLISYGGTSVVTLLAGFGILMGLYSHRKLVNS